MSPSRVTDFENTRKGRRGSAGDTKEVKKSKWRVSDRA